MITNKAVREIFEKDLGRARYEIEEAREDYMHALKKMQEAGRTVWNLEIYIASILRILDGANDLNGGK